MEKDKIYIFTHIPKTAGSNILKAIHKNLNPQERLEISAIKLNFDPDISLKDLKKQVKTKMCFLGKKRLQRVRIIYGHFVPYGIHEYFDREPYYFTFFREPSKRILSLYNYNRTLYRYGEDKNHPMFNKVLKVDGKIPIFSKWYKHHFKKSEDIRKMNSKRILNKLGYKNLNAFEVVGLVKNFSKDSLYIYNKLGFNKFFMKQNVSSKFKHSLTNAEKDMIYKENKPAFELFEEAKVVNKRLRQRKGYQDIIKAMRLKKKLLLPATQVLYDPIDVVRQSSSYLRTKSDNYERFADFLKSIDR